MAMNFKALIFPLIFISTPVLAQKTDWLSKYLQAKSIKCTLTPDQLKTQVKSHIDHNIAKLSETLKQRGSAFQTIVQQRDQVEIGIFPKTAGIDFYVSVNVSVVIGQFNFQIQTTYFGEGPNPTVQKGLWFPLAVNDLGSKKPCQLERVILNESERRLFPAVDLVIGGPPRVVASYLIDVVDTAEQKLSGPQTQVKTMAPQPTPTPTPSVDSSEEKDQVAEPKKKSRSEERRERRRQRREERHRRRHRTTYLQAPAPAEPPKDDCSGDRSAWKAVTCTLSGK